MCAHIAVHFVLPGTLWCCQPSLGRQADWKSMQPKPLPLRRHAHWLAVRGKGGNEGWKSEAGWEMESEERGVTARSPENKEKLKSYVTSALFFICIFPPKICSTMWFFNKVYGSAPSCLHTWKDHSSGNAAPPNMSLVEQRLLLAGSSYLHKSQQIIM